MSNELATPMTREEARRTTVGVSNKTVSTDRTGVTRGNTCGSSGAIDTTGWTTEEVDLDIEGEQWANEKRADRNSVVGLVVGALSEVHA